MSGNNFKEEKFCKRIGEIKEVKATKKLQLNQETIKNLIQKQNFACTLHSDQSFVVTGCLPTQCNCPPK